MNRCTLLLGAAVIFSFPASRAVASDPVEAKTLMTERGKLICSHAFDQPLATPWRAAKGSWTVAEGAMQVKELKEDMHGAVARRPVPHANFIVQYSFKLDGARATTLSINDAKGHCCRVLVNATGIAVRKDSHDHNQTDKPLELDKHAVPLAPGQWHTLVVEILGPEMVASLDGKTVAFGSHASIDVLKKDIGLTVAGESVSFKDLRVWEAKPNPSWTQTKAALSKSRAASAGS